MPATSVLFLTAVIALFLLLMIFEFKDSLAASPNFSVEHVLDSINDEYDIPFVGSDCESPLSPPLYTDIAQVDYISDGNVLNATAWLSPSAYPVIDQQDAQLTTQLSTVFSISFNTISEYESEDVDYAFEVQWDISNQSWIGTVYQFNPSHPINHKILAHIDNQSGFFEINEHYFHLSLPLKYLNYPERYNALVSLNAQPERYEDLRDLQLKQGFVETIQPCSVVDMTNWALFPAPKFNTTISPSSVILRPGEQGTVELKVKSDASRDSTVELDAVSVPNLMPTFTPYNFSLPSYSESFSRLTVRAPQEDLVLPGSYQLNINQKISLAPTMLDITANSSQVEGTRLAPFSTNRTIPITVTLLPPLTTEERLSNFVNSWITPIGVLWTFLVGAAAVISPLVLRVYRQRKKKGGAEYSNNA